MKTILGDNVKDIKMSSRLTDSPCCLVADQNDPTARMQEMMKAMGQGQPGGSEIKPIMEINPKHGLIKKIHKMKKDITREEQEVSIRSQNVTNALFVGSTAELQKLLNNRET